jgi:hypothetical protein
MTQAQNNPPDINGYVLNNGTLHRDNSFGEINQDARVARLTSDNGVPALNAAMITSNGGGNVLDGEGGRDLFVALFDPPGCLLIRQIDRLGQEVDARNLLAPASEEQGVLARAASGVENRASDSVGHLKNRSLRPADFPTRLPSVQVLEAAAVVDGHGSLTCSD